jgi:UDP-N-acetylenolpyruvoylglucosamine reductase
MTRTSAIVDRPAQDCEQLANELGRRLSSATRVRCREPLAKRTTLRVGGPADFYVEPAAEADLAATLAFCEQRALKFFVLGRGSNLLVRDGGFRGVVLCLAQPQFSRIEIVENRLHCGAGAKLKQVAVEARRHGLSGVEFLEGIPGSVGGALRMNAGAMGGSTFDMVETIRVMAFNGRIEEFAASDLEFEYRGCALLKNHIALAAVFKCASVPPAVGVTARRAERRVHFQKPGDHSGGQAGGGVGVERLTRGRSDGVNGTRQFHRQRRHGDRARCPGIDRSFATEGARRARYRVAHGSRNHRG